MKTNKNLLESNSIYENENLSLKYSTENDKDVSVLLSPYSNANIDFEKHIEKLRSSTKRPFKAFNHNKSVDLNNSKLLLDKSDFSRKSRTEVKEELKLPFIKDESSNSALNQISKSQLGIMDLFTSQTESFQGIVQEMKEMKHFFKSQSNNNKKIETLSDQINFIQNFLNQEFNSSSSTNNTVLKEIESVKKNQDKISQKLIVMSNEVKKTESNVAEFINQYQKTSSTCETNESFKNYSTETDINSKNIKQILNILSSNFNQNFNDSEKLSDRIIKIEKSIDVLERMTFQKLEKFDKQSDNIIHSINTINKYVREYRIEMDGVKALMKNNKDKLSQDLFKHIELQIDNFNNNFKIMDEKYSSICSTLEFVNSTTQSMNKTKFEQEKIFDQNDKIRDEILTNLKKNVEEIKINTINVDSKNQEINLHNIKNSQLEIFEKNDTLKENILSEINNLQKLITQIKKVSIDIKEDVTFDKILKLHKENKEEDKIMMNNIKELFENQSTEKANQHKQIVTKCSEIFKEVENGNKMAQLGFDDARLHKKMAEEKLTSINANTLLIPKMGNSDKKDVSKDLEGILSKINNLTNIVIKNQKELVK